MTNYKTISELLAEINEKIGIWTDISNCGYRICLTRFNIMCLTRHYLLTLQKENADG